ncbi:ribosomal protein S18 acetylase RimI-like enzyme [Arcicella aurantiaca]|uniref:Ribosomal protein S18 acetylase RimI-like enzyme n=1 Tax=Arcicella aurantiaca TaxID=591202 RepID=A0A316DX97_9BACT|nr:N-acetyltransferase [Arcicella aurantiaca]PWK22664.1 ribosomal protein S18 acetylase RimI-like enzyme [Arcicella aurantiaca]
MQFRRITEQDADAVWNIIHTVIKSGDTWVYAPDSSREKMLDIWFEPSKYAYVAEIDGEIAGTFFLKANQPDLGSHVANAGYMVHPDFRGRGLAEAMCRFSMEEAKRLDFKAMQFNIVMATNTGAIRLWQKCGFEIIGTLPKVYQHQTLGLTDALVMYQWLA